MNGSAYRWTTYCEMIHGFRRIVTLAAAATPCSETRFRKEQGSSTSIRGTLACAKLFPRMAQSMIDSLPEKRIYRMTCRVEDCISCDNGQSLFMFFCKIILNFGKCAGISKTHLRWLILLGLVSIF